MTIPMKNLCQLWGGNCPTNYATRHIPQEFTAALPFGRPITSFEDPRLECPELLILHGFHYADGAYRAGSGAHNQTFCVRDDGALVVTTCSGERWHEAVRHPDGRTESQVFEGLAGVLL